MVFFAAYLTHSLYLNLLTIPKFFLFNDHLLGSPWSSITFLDRFKFGMPLKQSAVGLIWPYLILSVELNLTFSSLVTLGRACNLRNMSPTFDM